MRHAAQFWTLCGRQAGFSLVRTSSNFVAVARPGWRVNCDRAARFGWWCTSGRGNLANFGGPFLRFSGRLIAWVGCGLAGTGSV